MHVIKLQPCGGSFFGHPYGHLFSIIIVITTSYCKKIIHDFPFHPCAPIPSVSNLFHLCHQINPKSQFNCLINFIYIVVTFPCYQLHHVESSSLPSTSLHSSFPSICLFHLGLETHFINCILIFMFDPYVYSSVQSRFIHMVRFQILKGASPRATLEWKRKTWLAESKEEI